MPIYLSLFYLWNLVLAVFFLYQGAFFGFISPGFALFFSIFGFAFVIMGSTGDKRTLTEKVPVAAAEPPPQGERLEFGTTESANIFTVLGLTVIVYALVVKFVPSFQLILDPTLSRRHLITMLVVGVLIASFRIGAFLDLKTRRAHRWLSVFGIKFHSKLDLGNAPEVQLHRTFLPFRSRRSRKSVNQLSRLVLKVGQHEWTFFLSAAPQEAEITAKALGLTYFRSFIEDRTQGLAAQQYENYRLNPTQELEHDSTQDGPPSRSPMRLLAPAVVVLPILVLGVAWFLPQPRGSTAAPSTPSSSSRVKKGPTNEVASPELNQAKQRWDALSDEAQPSEEQLRDILTLLEAGCKATPEVYWGYLYKGEVKFELGLHKEALVDLREYFKRGGKNHEMAWRYREAGHPDTALEIVELSLHGTQRCEPSVLKSLLLFELKRDKEAMQFDPSSCRNCQGLKELKKLREAYRSRAQ